ncbi:hypothetical protein HDU78_005474 [Chytriomyces hyalinus]|nr:hypothetical protein HDU78_005474 [Chytriomyces hyalinus]
MSWESVRRQAKQLENEVELKLSNYSKCISSSSSDGASISINMEAASLLPAFSQSEQMESDLEDCLRRLTKVTNQMAEFLDSPNQHMPTNPSMMHVLQRHREILYDYSKEFNRTKANAASSRSHAELLSGGIGNRGGSSGNSGMGLHDMMLNERNNIDRAHGIADTVLEQAYTTREQLDSQGQILAKSRSRIGGVLERFPAINNLVGKISSKKRRDQMIVAGVLGVCAFILIWAIAR